MSSLYHALRMLRKREALLRQLRNMDPGPSREGEVTRHFVKWQTKFHQRRIVADVPAIVIVEPPQLPERNP